MKLGAILLLLGGMVQAVPAAAAPCVGVAYDQPFPGAVDVVMRYADVPSSQFPGIWQEGMVAGNFYQIYANRTAILRADRLSLDWSITVECQQRPCLQTVTGLPPDAAKATSIQLEQCLVPPEIKLAAASASPKPDQAKPKAQTSAIEAPEEAKPKDPVKAADLAPAKGGKAGNGAGGTAVGPATQGRPTMAGTAQQTGVNTGVTNGVNTGVNTGVTIGPATSVVCPAPQQNTALRPLICGLALVPPDTPAATLQRLLVLAGADPGAVDGSFGPKTKNAVVQVLGFAGRDLDLPQAISAVDAYLCRMGQPQP